MNDFSDRLIRILNHGALNLALGIGYSHGIFDVLDAQDAPVSLETLAELTGLDRRYLREWLGIMTTGNIIDIHSDSNGGDQTDRFSLPKAHGDLLCRRAGSKNLGVYTQEIPLLTASALKPVSRGFITGEGVPFSCYPEFQSFMSQLSDAKHEKVLVKEFLPAVDNGRLVEKLTAGIRVCDLGCGQGVAMNLMAEAFPNSEFTGIDNHEAAIAAARVTADEKGLTNARFIVRDAATLTDDTSLAGRFDWICAFDAIHDQSHPLKALKGVHHILRPGGQFSMIDIKADSHIQENMDHPMAPFLYTVSLMHCMPVGLNDNGRGLGMMWGKQKATALLKEAGFTEISAEEIPNDPFNLHFLCSP